MQDKAEKTAKLTEAQRAVLEALEAMTGGQTDFSGMPETTLEQWARAKHGLFYQPGWQDVTLHLDQNVVEWFERMRRNTRRGPPGNQPGPVGTRPQGMPPARAAIQEQA